MTCKDCPYCEKWEGEAYPHCHFEEITGEDMSWLNVPPCEEDPEPVIYYHSEGTFSYECGNCHMPIDEDAHYCKWCGVKVKED